MKFNWLENKVADICGNYMVRLDDTITILTDLSDGALSDQQYKTFETKDNNQFSSDISTVFSKAEPETFYSSGEIEEDRLIRTTLVLYSGLPDRFVIMKKNGSTEEKDHTIHATWSFTDDSFVGKYFQAHINEEGFDYDPIFVNYRERVIDVTCIELEHGVITKLSIPFDNATNDFVSKIFKKKKIIPCNIIPISFRKDWDESEDDEYYWFYASDIKLGDFLTESLARDFFPLSGRKFTSLQENVIDYNGLYVSDAPYYYSKSGGEITSCKEISNSTIEFDEELPSYFKVDKDIKLTEQVDRRKAVSIAINSEFVQSDTITFHFKSRSVTLIADALFNKPDFGLRDSERFVFNPTGDQIDQLHSICGALEWLIEDKILLDCFVVDDKLILRDNNEFLENQLVGLDSGGKLQIENLNDKIVGGDGFMVKAPEDIYGKFVKSNTGFHKIIATFSDPENLSSPNYYANNSYFGEKDLERTWTQDRIEYGIFNPVLSGSIDTIIKTNKTIINTTVQKYLPLDSLEIGETYIVQDFDIVHNGIQYPPSGIFVAVSEEFESLSSASKVYQKRFFDDNEVQLFLNKHLSDITDPETVDVKYSWVSTSTKDSKQEDYSLDFSQIQNFDEHDFSPVLNTHSFYLLSSDFDEVFDETKYSSTNIDYFNGYFRDEYSVIKKNDSDQYETIFNGAKLVFKEDYEGYKFSCILNTLPLDDANTANIDPLNFKIIKNDFHKSIVFKIDLYLDDYKEYDYSYIAMMMGINKLSGQIGQTFLFPTITGVGFANPDFIGAKINKKENLFANPPVDSMEFIGEMFRLDTWVRQYDGSYGGIIGIDRGRESFISNMPNVGTLGSVLLGDPTDVEVNVNTLTFLDNQVYVLAINGTIYDTILPFSTVKSIEIFDDYEWYQVTSPSGVYERVGKLLSVAGLYDVLNNQPLELVDEIGGMTLVKPKKELYSNDFNLDTKHDETFLGSIVLQNWSLMLQNWVSATEITWINAPVWVDLGFILSDEININKQ